MQPLLLNVSKKQALIYAAFLVAYEFLTYIANDMIMPAMINVVNNFKAPETAIATSLTAYVLGGASLQIFLGPISDRYGRKPVMLFGVFFFFLFTIAIANSKTIDQFLILRFFQGMGLCYIAVIGYSTLQEIFAEMDAIRLISIMANVAIIAPLLGPLIGAVFIKYFSWRYIFVAIAILSLISFIGLSYFMPESVGHQKTDGTIIKRINLSFRVIYKSYRRLFYNPTFIFGSIGLGILSVPCLAWIGLSPIMLVVDGGLTNIQYALWQIPIFGSYILGIIFLQRMTRTGTIARMIILGSTFSIISLLLVFILPSIFNFNYIWLMPGLMGYFFGAGIVPAPLSRLILFSTKVTKGTASALMNIITMCILAIGVEIGNHIYKTHNNYYFALFCIFSAIIYCIGMILCFWAWKKSAKMQFSV